MRIFSRAGLLSGLGMLLGLVAQAQPQIPSSENLTMETLDEKTRLLVGWTPNIKENLPPRPGYQLRIESDAPQQGKYALRLSSEPDTKPGGYGVAMYHLPARYEGRSITLTGYLKTSAVQQGFAGLWMRLDGPNGSLAFDNMQKTNLQGTHSWQRYTITLPLAAEAQTIYVGGILTGTGTLWLDNLELTIDGKPLAQVPARQEVVYKAQTDTAFQKSSGIVLSTLSRQQLENLAVLGQVWGFLKYYHPAVARGDYNWDKELFRIMPQVLASKTTKARSQVLSTWLTGLGPVTTSASTPTPTAPVRIQPTLAWLTNDKLLSKELQKQLTYLRDHPTQLPKHYYIRSQAVGNPAFLHEEAYANMKYPDAGYRLLALFRYWNIIEYFFPYKYAIGEDWQRKLPDFLPEFVAASNALEYRFAVLRLLTSIRDSHASLFPDPVLTQYTGDYIVPAVLKFIDDQAVVLRVRQDPKPPLEPGDIITHLDGVAVADIVKKRLLITPGSNKPAQLRFIASDLLFGTTPQVQLQVLRDGKALTFTASRPKRSTLPPVQPLPADSTHRFLTPDIGYVTMGKISQAKLPIIFRDFKNTKGMVIDIRNYPAEFVVNQLAPYFLTQPTAYAQFTAPNIHIPGQFLAGEPDTLQPVSQPYTGKVVVLVDENSISLSEYTAMALRATPHATILGSQTAGADGNVSRIVLPGNLASNISGLGVYYPDWRETQRIGIVPDVVAYPTVAGIRAGRDEVLEKAVQLIENEK